MQHTSTSTPTLSTSHTHKKPFSVSQLIIGLILSTYFLSVALIEFSLSIYVQQQNKPHLFQQYLLFKQDTLLWKSWQLITTAIIPLSLFDAITGLYQIFTHQATQRRNLLDIIKAAHLFAILYITITRLMPLESQIKQSTPSMSLLQQINYFHHFTFALNILGLIIPLLYYHDSKHPSSITSTKKDQ